MMRVLAPQTEIPGFRAGSLVSSYKAGLGVRSFRGSGGWVPLSDVL